MNAQRNRRNYTKEFKADAVGLMIEQGYSSAQAGRRFGVSENNVNRWVRQYRDQHEIASTDGLTREQLESELIHLSPFAFRR
jgi:transposase